MSQQHRTLSTRWRTELEAIAAQHGFTLARLQAPGKFRKLVAARRDCYRYLADQGWSTSEIGGLFNRDHTTVLWSIWPDEVMAVKRARKRIKPRSIGASL